METAFPGFSLLPFFLEKKGRRPPRRIPGAVQRTTAAHCKVCTQAACDERQQRAGMNRSQSLSQRPLVAPLLTMQPQRSGIAHGPAGERRGLGSPGFRRQGQRPCCGRRAQLRWCRESASGQAEQAALHPVALAVDAECVAAKTRAPFSQSRDIRDACPTAAAAARRDRRTGGNSCSAPGSCCGTPGGIPRPGKRRWQARSASRSAP